jgi:hypothetical protein
MFLLPLLVMSMGENMSPNYGHQRAYCSSSRWYMSLDSHGRMILTGETKELGKKPVPVPLYPLQIPHGLTRTRTWATAVRVRRLMAWAMARPDFNKMKQTTNRNTREKPCILWQLLGMGKAWWGAVAASVCVGGGESVSILSLTQL